MAALSVVFSTGCAVLHHVQVGNVDNRDSSALVPFEVLMSEIGVNTEEIGKMARLTNSKGGDAVGDAAGIVSLFQIGPRTGNLTYNVHYAERLIYEIYQRCPSGDVTGLMSIREMRKYPAISGEIVKVTGYCRKTRKPVSGVSKLEVEAKGNLK
ncbi:MAG: hypothetical protein ACXVCY_01845 [Pseudobdellovibrionaceae bacterium]